MLVVILIFLSINGIIISILSSTLRGTSKTKINNAVAQNGNYALSVISNTIANSSKINSMAGNTAACSGILPTPTPGLSNYIDLTGMDGIRKIIVCDDTAHTIRFTNGATSYSLIDTSQVVLAPSSVPVWCSFTCDQKNNDWLTPIITVSFRLNQAQGSVSERQASAVFHTSISLRNYR